MERVTLSFKDGVTRSPSVIACTDNSLAASVGMVYEGEFKPIQKPKELGTIEPEVIYIHHFKYTHYIAIQTVEGNKTLVYTSPSGSINSIESMDYEISNMTSIGNTLIATTDKGMRYYLWKNDSYIPLGLMPKIDAEFELTDVTLSDSDKPRSADILAFDYENDKEGLRNALSGVVYKTINNVKKLGCFMFPFWVRLAYRLYDGRNIMVTSPVLMLPSVRYNRLVYVRDTDYLGAHAYARFHPIASSLWIKVNTDLTNWGDIISGIDVYLSDDVITMDLEGDWDYQALSDYAFNDKITCVSEHFMHYSSNSSFPSDAIGILHDNDQYWIPRQKTDRVIIDELIDKSVFYRAAYIENPVSGFMRLETYLKGNSILYLTTQHQLEHDDYFNHCKLTAESMIAYNGRVQISNITRWFFEGFKTHLPLYVNQNVNVYVKIETQSGTRVIHADTISGEAIGYYYFFPDPRARQVWFDINGTVYTKKLSEHPHLNGAYFLDLPTANTNGTLSTDTLPTVYDVDESLPNTIMVSEVNNPFLFATEGANQVGTGNVLAIASNTDALSEGQFGEHPLIAFTSEGIWGLTVNKEGYYETADPMSRDICEGSVIQTDSNIFFMSKKGLMMITGRKVTCVSEQLIGKPNPYDLGIDLPINAKMAYDYKNSRLWIIGDSDYVYIFSMKTGTFAQYLMEDHIKSVHNLYPDNIFQTESGKILSLDTIDINSDSNSYSGVLISRPIKMMDILSYKSIEDLECHYTGENAEVTLYGSTDHINWYQVPHFKSKPWKYFVLKIELTNFMANDVFSGITLAFKPKRVFRLHPETNVKENEYNDLMSNNLE